LILSAPIFLAFGKIHSLLIGCPKNAYEEHLETPTSPNKNLNTCSFNENNHAQMLIRMILGVVTLSAIIWRKNISSVVKNVSYVHMSCSGGL